MADNKIIKLQDKVEVIATDKSKTYKAGTKYKVHPLHVDYLLENGLIEKPKAK